MRLLITAFTLIAALVGCGGKSESSPSGPQCSGFNSGTVPTLATNQLLFDSDGTKIAWLVNVNPAANGGIGRWAIRIATVGQTATYLIDDGNINSKPAWSLDSQTI